MWYRAPPGSRSRQVSCLRHETVRNNVFYMPAMPPYPIYAVQPHSAGSNRRPAASRRTTTPAMRRMRGFSRVHRIHLERPQDPPTKTRAATILFHVPGGAIPRRRRGIGNTVSNNSASPATTRHLRNRNGNFSSFSGLQTRREFFRRGRRTRLVRRAPASHGRGVGSRAVHH